jgi:hypothetical protein
MPVSLTKDLNLITRPVMPFYNIVPHETAPGNFERATGLGDLALVELLSPAHSGNWILGAGPTAIFPTATSEFTGHGKWQLGPTVVVGYLTKQYFIGVFPQQWWSIGGQHFRRDTNQMNLQPIASIFFGEGWSLGYSGNILADWTAPSEDVWTVPVGLGLAKVVKLGRLPVKIQLSVQYMPVHPRISGQEWNVSSRSLLSFRLIKASCSSDAESHAINVHEWLEPTFNGGYSADGLSLMTKETFVGYSTLRKIRASPGRCDVNLRGGLKPQTKKAETGATKKDSTAS